MSFMVSQITSKLTVCLAGYSGWKQRNNRGLFQWPFERGIYQWVGSTHKGPVMRKAFPCHDIVMYPLESWRDTVECRYNVVRFITILHVALWWQKQDVYLNLISQQTPHTSPSRASCGVSIMRILGKIDRVIMAPHCMYISHTLLSFLVVRHSVMLRLLFNSLWPSDTIWWKRSGSTCALVMACCHRAISNYWNQCWLIIGMILWHSSEGNFIRDIAVINHQN